MTQPPDRSKITLTPNKERISLSYASLALLGTMTAALGGAFMHFYSQVCTPQVLTAQSEKKELLTVLNQLSLQIQTNTKAIEDLHDRQPK
ncbi:MAG: hypothetical protein KME35_08090 [Aphanocapsa sp. GSE-SYN-MK-11-07L]|jgi:hypothetical protein|nr:hypothetical protein [Aphanocapsa sp. GSE-SYN-MK-11-07L]